MSRRTLAMIPTLALVLGVGAALADQPGPTDGGPAGVGTAGLAHVVGQPEAALADVTLPEGTRVLHPGDVMTMDYNPERLNIDIGEDGAITSVHCG